MVLFGLAVGCGDSGTGPDTRPDGYTDEELSYFAELAFGAEYGGSATPLLHRWETSPSIRVHGIPSSVDEGTLAQVIGEINALAGDVRLQRTDGTADINFFVVPQADFPRHEPNYVPGNQGFVWISWDQTQRIVRASILISSDISQEARSHLIREELTQSLGLLRDSPRYPESIFYQGSSLSQSYAPIDRAIIEMLYRPELSPGATQEGALRILRRLRRGGATALAWSVAQDARERSWHAAVRHPYSDLSATRGSTRAARRAGTSAAARATSASSPATAPRVTGSLGFTPKSSPPITRVTASAPMRPSTTPANDSASVRRSTMRATSRPRAPSATRIPISRVRSATEYDSTP